MKGNNNFVFQLNRLEHLLEEIPSQQKSILECFAGKQPAVNLENRTTAHSPSPGTEKITLTVSELQQILGISKPEAYDLVHQDDFPSFRVGRKILISRSGLEGWITRQMTTTTERGVA